MQTVLLLLSEFGNVVKMGFWGPGSMLQLIIGQGLGRASIEAARSAGSPVWGQGQHSPDAECHGAGYG
jgi:hypothetical protein